MQAKEQWGSLDGPDFHQHSGVEIRLKKPL
jgi:hypothetical protein